MKYFIITLMLLILGCKEKSPKPPNFQFKEPILIKCDSMRHVAKTDYDNGIREYNLLGSVEMTELELFYWDYMRDKYKITIKTNDVPSFLEECYAESMNDEVEKEYGSEFIDKTYREAEIEFAKSN